MWEGLKFLDSESRALSRMVNYCKVLTWKWETTWRKYESCKRTLTCLESECMRMSMIRLTWEKRSGTYNLISPSLIEVMPSQMIYYLRLLRTSKLSQWTLPQLHLNQLHHSSLRKNKSLSMRLFSQNVSSLDLLSRLDQMRMHWRTKSLTEVCRSKAMSCKYSSCRQSKPESNSTLYLISLKQTRRRWARCKIRWSLMRTSPSMKRTLRMRQKGEGN